VVLYDYLSQLHQREIILRKQWFKPYSMYY